MVAYAWMDLSIEYFPHRLKLYSFTADKYTKSNAILLLFSSFNRVITEEHWP